MNEKYVDPEDILVVAGTIIFIVLILSITFFNVMQDNSDKKIEYARAGLQQCLIGGDIVWQRECVFKQNTKEE
jgi:hypothetical protein